jgi:hypothetical protein
MVHKMTIPPTDDATTMRAVIAAVLVEVEVLPLASAEEEAEAAEAVSSTEAVLVIVECEALPVSP